MREGSVRRWVNTSSVFLITGGVTDGFLSEGSLRDFRGDLEKGFLGDDLAGVLVGETGGLVILVKVGGDRL